MQFRGKLTDEDLNDLRRVVRSKMYWPKLFVANWYGLMLLCVVLWATIAGLLGATHPNWSAVGVLWVVLLGLFTWAFYSVKRKMAKEFLQLNATLPDWISLVDDGTKLNGPNGATGFWPWNNFKGWRERKRVMLLDMQTGAFVILPVGELSDPERQPIRQFLRLHIPSASATAASPV
jgi:hypothetical protein